ncbi:uncharacterized protein VSU04_010333 [Chlamydotis macqueenii]
MSLCGARVRAVAAEELLQLKLERPQKGGGLPSGQSYRRGEKQKAASDLSDSPSSAGSESCASEAPRAAVAALDFLAMSGAAFHRGRPFLGHESTRWMERSRSGLQVQRSGAVSEHSCWLGLNHGTSAFSSSVLGSSDCGAAPGWGQTSNWSDRRGREERRKKGLNWQTLPGALRAVQPPSLPDSPALQDTADPPYVPCRTNERGSWNDLAVVPGTRRGDWRLQAPEQTRCSDLCA